MRKKSIIFISILVTLFMGGCGDKSRDNRQTIHEEPADETILTKNSKTESTDSEDVEEKVADKVIDKNSTLSIPPELLNSTRKRVIPKPMPTMPPELEGIKREMDKNKTEVISRGPDGVDLSKIEKPEEPLPLPPELLDNKAK
ncbi:hypothetical protein MNB_SV-6-337 [hydrothermal vent metagenome]|uniref:Lipoprotein n=1 Tax=hydrothermal vent metagenome TaxID=652676 RepID=A0A1W1CGM3_9ZZZZ